MLISTLVCFGWKENKSESDTLKVRSPKSELDIIKIKIYPKNLLLHSREILENDRILAAALLGTKTLNLEQHWKSLWTVLFCLLLKRKKTLF